jgi:hypothetical protein
MQITAPKPTGKDALAVASEDGAFVTDFQAVCVANPLPSAVPNIQVNGKPVYVARLTAAGLDAYYKELQSVPEDIYRAGLLAFAIRDKFGKRIFGPDHLHMLAETPSEIAVPISEHFLEVNGMSGRRKN